MNELEEPHMFLGCFQKTTKIQYVSYFILFNIKNVRL